MRKFITVLYPQAILGSWLIFSLSFFCNIQTVRAESNLTVEGEWEMISTKTNPWRQNIGKRISISRNGNIYDIKYWDGGIKDYQGTETQIVRSFPEYLCEPEDSHGAGAYLPRSVCNEVAGQQVMINQTFTLSADGFYLTQARDARWVYWNDGHYTHHEVKPRFYTAIFKRISEPTKVEKRSAIAQVESRGEFYVLTKGGRKLTGKDANQVPLEEGTKVITGSDGHIRMMLPDDTTFTIGPNSDIVIDSFVYDPDNTPKKIIANMSKGVFRWVTGKTKPLKDSTEMKVKLPAVAVGIRGTDFETTVHPDGSGFLILNFGQLEITEKKTGFKFIMDAGYKVIFDADGSISRPIKSE